MDIPTKRLSFTRRIRGRLAVVNRCVFIAVLLAMLTPKLVLAAAAVGFSSIGSGGVFQQAPAPIEAPNFGQHRETVMDVRVKVLGGYFRINRSWDAGKWYINESLDKFELKFNQSGSATSQKALIYYEGVNYGEVTIQTNQNTGLRSFELPATTLEIGYSKDKHKRLIWTGSAFRIVDKWGYWTEFYSPGDTIISHVYAAKQGDRNNVQISFQYAPSSADDEGHKVITGVVDHLGKQIIWYEYNNPSNPRELSAIRDYSNRRVEYKYTGDDLTEVIDVRGNSWKYTYEKSGDILLLKTKTDPDGRVTAINYGPNRQVTSILNQDESGSHFKYEYLSGKNQFYKQERTTGGKVTEVWFDEEGEFTRQDINGITITSITKQGQYKTVTDRSGNSTKEEYDQWENLVKRTHPDNSFITRKYDPKFASLLEEVNEKGVITKYDYDANGNLKTKTEAFGLPEQRIVTYSYDQYGNLLSLTHEADAVTSEVVYAWTYDDYGNQKTYTDGESHQWSYTHDIMGNVLTETEPASTRVWTYTYDAAGNQTSEKDPLDHLTQYIYDGWGNKIKIIDAKSHSTTYTYDLNNRLAKITDHLNNDFVLGYNIDGHLIKATDRYNRTITVDYDLEGRPIIIKDGNNNAIQLMYNTENENGAGELSEIKYPTFERAFIYDVRGRVIGEVDALSPTQVNETIFVYDAVGNIVKMIDPKKRESAYTFDALNRLVKWLDPLNQETSYDYDNRDNLRTITDVNGNATSYNPDGNNQVVSETKPMNQTLTFTYDPAGRLSSHVDAKGQKTEYLYDDAGRLEAIQNYASLASTTSVKTVSFVYDAANLLSGYNDGTTSATYTYDELNRKTGVTVNFGPFSKSYGYTYTGNGKKQSFTAVDGTIYTFNYNAANRLSAIQIPGLGAITLDSFEWQQPKTVSFPGGVIGELTYDGLQRVQDINIKDPAKNPIISATYTRDAVGNILNQATEHGVYEYSYNLLDRLTQVNNPNLADEIYTYDPVGNRLTDNNRPGNWTYDDNNQLTDVGANISFAYDDNGSTISKSIAGATTEYVYDLNNRLSEVKQGSSTIATYSYDPFGRRISKNVAGQVTYFMYADEGLIAEFNSTGAIVRQYGYQPDSLWGTDPVYLKTEEQYFFYQNDHLGTPKKLTATNGAVVWSAEYYAFGGLDLAVGSAIENPLRFPGQYYDSETQLHYNLFRFYDPTAGRYITSDPIGLAGGYNTYLYAEANPVVYGDNEGLLAFNVIGGVIGGICGYFTGGRTMSGTITGIVSGMLPGWYGAAASAIGGQFGLPTNSCISDRLGQLGKDAAGSAASAAANRNNSQRYRDAANRAARNRDRDVMTRVRNQRYFNRRASEITRRATRRAGIAGCIAGAIGGLF